MSKISIFKPRRVESRFLKLKKELDKYITIDEKTKNLIVKPPKDTWFGEGEYNIILKYYSNYVINVIGDVFLDALGDGTTTKLSFKFGEVTGYFSCENNPCLKSTINFPEKVRAVYLLNTLLKQDDVKVKCNTEFVNY
jgi:hypothetical protein